MPVLESKLEGKKAPAFALKNQAGEAVKLAELKGKYVVLYFYPKDNTPGCTQEACDFRDSYKKLVKQDVVVLGVSPDSEKSHQNFIAKYALPFDLLVDAEHAVAEKYGAWGEKSMYGKKFMGLIRSTFLIGPDGVLIKAWPKVKVAGHVDDVAQAIAAARAG